MRATYTVGLIGFIWILAVLTAPTADAQSIDVVGHWKFDGTDPVQALDSSGNAHHGAIDGAIRVAGLNGGALLFDGVDDKVIVPHQASLDVSGAITIEVVVKSNGAQKSAFVPLIAKNVPGATSTGYALWVAGDKNENTAFTYFHTPPWSVGEWHHIVFQHDGNVARFYVDGVLVEERPPGRVDRATPSPRFVEIGGSDNRSPHPGRGTFNGVIDEIRVSRGVLTPGEFLSLNSPPIADAGDPIRVECVSHAGAPVTLTGLLSSDPDGDPLTFGWTGPFPEGGGSVSGAMPTVTLPLGVHDVTLTVMDALGELASDSVRVTVEDTVAPQLSGIPGPLEVEAEGPDGAAVELGLPEVIDACDASATVSSDAPDVFPLGTTPVSFVGADASGNQSIASTEVTVLDTTPPRIDSVSPSRDSLWPPNHRMVPVGIEVDVVDLVDPDPACRVVSVTSNEAVNGKGDGNTEPDWRITGPLAVDLRAERSGRGEGRVYAVTVKCEDSSGNVAVDTTEVVVPKSQGRR